MISKICVVIPAYNASETIAKVITATLKYIPHVMVADDGSTDNTAKIATEAGAEVIIIDKNRGKGHALKILFSMALENNYDAAITIDADGQHDPELIPNFIQAYNAHPDKIFVGSRMHEKEKIPRARYNSMQVANFFISLSANQFIEDTQCGFRLYPLKIINNILLTTERYVTETELLIKAGDMGVCIEPIVINTLYGNHSSHFKPVIDVSAITIYVISYLITKWFIEGLFPQKSYTYELNSIHDVIGRNKKVHKLFQLTTLLTFLALTIIYLIWYIYSSLVMKNNFASVRCFKYGYFIVVLAAEMLPVLLILTIIDKLIILAGIRAAFVDKFIKAFYPNLWAEKNSINRNSQKKAIV